MFVMKGISWKSDGRGRWVKSKITIHNNMLALSYNIDGLAFTIQDRIIRNSKLTESEISKNWRWFG